MAISTQRGRLLRQAQPAPPERGTQSGNDNKILITNFLDTLNDAVNSSGAAGSKMEETRWGRMMALNKLCINLHFI